MLINPEHDRATPAFELFDTVNDVVLVPALDRGWRQLKTEGRVQEVTVTGGEKTAFSQPLKPKQTQGKTQDRLDLRDRRLL